jgi:DNA-directed RNA polymerase specialized sigma24 family protein
MPSETAAAAVEQELIEAERNAALRSALAELPDRCRELLSMLISDPPTAYAEISAALGIAVGSIGPIRARCLDRLRRSPHLAGYLSDGVQKVEVSEAGR